MVQMPKLKDFKNEMDHEMWLNRIELFFDDETLSAQRLHIALAHLDVPIAVKDKVCNLRSLAMTNMYSIHTYDMYVYYTYKGGVYVGNIDTFGVRVPHRVSAYATSTPLLPQWCCGRPIPYILYQSSWFRIRSDTYLRPESVRRDMPERLVWPASMVTVVRWTSGGVRAPPLACYEILGG